MDTKTNNNGWTAIELEKLLNGKWYKNPPSDEWRALDFAVGETGYKDKNTMFIAIDTETWLKGSGNTGIYAEWKDTHEILHKYTDKFSAAIVQRPIKELPEDFPQLVVDNSYDVINIMAREARKNYTGKIIAITGTAGKSTTKEMVNHLLKDDLTVVSTKGNHNTRTGVPMTMAACKHNPQVCVLETAISALWMKKSISQLTKPHICIITSIGLNQTNRAKDEHETAYYKSRVCEGIEQGGVAILNFEMNEYDFVKEEVVRYGAKPISYGLSSSCDSFLIEQHYDGKRTMVKANILGNEVCYSLNLFGTGMVLNSIAALTSAYFMDLDMTHISKKFESFEGNKSLLQISKIETRYGDIMVVDDSHNATIISMISAFDSFKLFVNSINNKKVRKIAILGRIVNLHEKAAEAHSSLVQPLIDSGIEMVFAYGEEMKYLVDNLPKSIMAVLFDDIEQCINVASLYIKSGDYVLIKGSRRGNDFGRAATLLEDKLRYKNDAPYCFAFDPKSKEVVSKIGCEDLNLNEGLGGILLIYSTIKMIMDKKISLSDEIVVKTNAIRENKKKNALGLNEGEKLSLSTALTAFIVSSSPDAALALSSHLRNHIKGTVLAHLKEIASSISLNTESVKNVTGRRRTAETQYFNVEDLVSVANLLFDLPDNFLKVLETPHVIHKNKILENETVLHSINEINYFLCFGDRIYNALTCCNIDGKRVYICTFGARTRFERDYYITKMISNLKQEENNLEIPKKTIDSASGKSILTICGDTYFGEWYTEARKKKNIEDSLQRYGYSHCFEEVAPFLENSDFNIINFEAVLTNKENSAFNGLIPFILKGDPQKSIDELKSRNVHAVMLGNNHIMDYGHDGCIDTLDAFKLNEILSIGAGRNVYDAEKPIHLSINKRDVFIFNAYWYRKNRHYNCRHYALGSESGAACISPAFILNVKEYRKLYPESFIILSAHWGTDFSHKIDDQRKLAYELTEAGVNCIVGHGPHIASKVEWINNSFVLYSIGNFVFNSSSTDLSIKALHVGYICRFIFEENNISLNIYPIDANNRKTFWQPKPITQEEFTQLQKSKHVQDIKDKYDVDELGHYFSINLI